MCRIVTKKTVCVHGVPVISIERKGLHFHHVVTIEQEKQGYCQLFFNSKLNGGFDAVDMLVELLNVVLLNYTNMFSTLCFKKTRQIECFFRRIPVIFCANGLVSKLF